MLHAVPFLLLVIVALLLGIVLAPRITRLPATLRTALLYLLLVHVVALWSLLTSPLLADGLAPLMLLTFPALALITTYQGLPSLASPHGLLACYLLLLWSALVNSCLLALYCWALEWRQGVPRGTLRRRSPRP